jgi:hypothetical protein
MREEKVKEVEENSFEADEYLAQNLKGKKKSSISTSPINMTDKRSARNAVSESVMEIPSRAYSKPKTNRNKHSENSNHYQIDMGGQSR